MKEFVLHQASQLAKLWNIATEKIDPVHQPQGAADFAFLRQHFFENFAWRSGVTIRARDLSKRAAEQIFQLRTKIDIVVLSELKRRHHFQRISFEKVAPVGV